MKDLKLMLMDNNVKEEDIPNNVLHLFQICTWDFGIRDHSGLNGRRINFMFCVKQRNDGKINSHKWFFQGICKFLKPKFCFLLDIGTRPDHYAVQKLYQYMIRNKQAGGVCGEIEVDIQAEPGANFTSYMVQAA